MSKDGQCTDVTDESIVDIDGYGSTLSLQTYASLVCR